MPSSQLPGRNPVLPDPSEAEAPSGPVAARLPEGTASAGLVLDPKIRCPAWPVSILPKGNPETGWALFETCRSRIR
jgi:hypothetical protein